MKNWLQLITDPTYGKNFSGWKNVKVISDRPPLMSASGAIGNEKVGFVGSRNFKNGYTPAFLTAVMAAKASNIEPTTEQSNRPANFKTELRKAFHPEEFTKKTPYDNKGKSVEEVKALQKRLGVSVDGKWGANTQKAYEDWMLSEKAKDVDLGPIKTINKIKTDKPKLAASWVPPDYLKKGGKTKEGKKNWIQKAVNPEHKGYCTPMTKSTCTPKRKAFAMTMKKHHGFQKKDGGSLIATNDSTKYYSDKLKTNISDHFKAKTKAEKDLAAQKATQSKNSLNRQANKGKVGFDKNGFPLVKKQNGGEMPKGGDQAAVYKKGTKIDASKWKKSK